MKYLIGYKQDENTYLYVNGINTNISVSMNYASALDFLEEEYAKSICSFLNEYDKNKEYIVLKYQYSIKEL